MIDTTKRIILWAVPRSVSTAFERIFLERDDTHVIHEPFSFSYYFSTERFNDRFLQDAPREDYAYQPMLESLFQENGKPITFIKDMPHHTKGIQDWSVFSKLQNTFLIRSPEEALSSLYKMMPDFTEEETGYKAQFELFHFVTKKLGQKPVVVDATDFRNSPDIIMKKYCQSIGIPFDETHLTWEQKKITKWETWKDWHKDAENSTGIKVPEKKDYSGLPQFILDLIQNYLPLYEEMYQQRIQM